MALRRIYSADVMVYATVYVIAENEDEARAKVADRMKSDLIAGESDHVSGAGYDSPDLPDISFSPAMTPNEGADFSVSLVEENDPEGEED